MPTATDKTTATLKTKDIAAQFKAEMPGELIYEHAVQIKHVTFPLAMVSLVMF
jgi:hypothetical protein